MRKKYSLEAAKSRDAGVADTLAKLQRSAKTQIRGTQLRQKRDAWLKELKRLKGDEIKSEQSLLQVYTSDSVSGDVFTAAGSIGSPRKEQDDVDVAALLSAQDETSSSGDGDGFLSDGDAIWGDVKKLRASVLRYRAIIESDKSSRGGGNGEDNSAGSQLEPLARDEDPAAGDFSNPSLPAKADIECLLELCQCLRGTNQVAIEKYEATIEELTYSLRETRRLANQLTNDGHLMDLSEDEEAFMAPDNVNLVQDKKMVETVDGYLQDIATYNEEYILNVGRKRSEIQAVMSELQMLDPTVRDICTQHFYKVFNVASVNNRDDAARQNMSNQGLEEVKFADTATTENHLQVGRTNVDAIAAEVVCVFNRDYSQAPSASSSALPSPSRERTKSECFPDIHKPSMRGEPVNAGEEQGDDSIPQSGVSRPSMSGPQSGVHSRAQKPAEKYDSATTMSVGIVVPLAEKGLSMVVARKNVLRCLRLLEKRRYIQMQHGVLYKTWREKRSERLKKAKKETEITKRNFVDGMDSILTSAKREMHNLQTRRNLMSLRVRKDQELMQKKLAKAGEVEKEMALVERIVEKKHARTRELHDQVDKYHEKKKTEKEMEDEKNRELDEKKKQEYMAMATENAKRKKVRDEIERIKNEEAQRRKAMREDQEEIERLRMAYILEKLRVDAPRDPTRLLRVPVAQPRYFDPKRAIVRDGVRDVHGYFEERLRQDPRYKMSAALHGANMLSKDAARIVMRNLNPVLPKGHALKSELPGFAR